MNQASAPSLVVPVFPAAGTAWAADPEPGEPKPGFDLHGDPLPRDVLLRLGTLRRRAVGATLAMSPDGQSIIGVRGGKYIHVSEIDKLSFFYEKLAEELQQTYRVTFESNRASSDGTASGLDIKIVRDGQVLANPKSSTPLAAHDLVGLLGDPDQIAAAATLLTRPGPQHDVEGVPTTPADLQAGATPAM